MSNRSQHVSFFRIIDIILVNKTWHTTSIANLEFHKVYNIDTNYQHVEVQT